MSGGHADLKALIGVVAQGRSLSEDEAEAAFDIIMSGNATPSQMGAFLMALRVRGETVDEIAGAARIMRAKAVAIDAPQGRSTPAAPEAIPRAASISRRRAH